MKKTLSAAVVAAGLSAGGASAQDLMLRDQAAITQAITAIAAGADRHDWPRVRAALSDTVTLDYTSLWGGEPTTQEADAVVAEWAGFLPGFDVTQHLVTNHTVALVSETAATAQADFQATHRTGDDLWVLGGRYDYDLLKTGDRWTVSSISMTALWETGDRGLVAVAAGRMEAN